MLLDDRATVTRLARSRVRLAHKQFWLTLRAAKGAWFDSIVSKWTPTNAEHVVLAYRMLRNLMAGGRNARSAADAALVSLGPLAVVRAWRGVFSTESLYAGVLDDCHFVFMSLSRLLSGDNARARLCASQLGLSLSEQRAPRSVWVSALQNWSKRFDILTVLPADLTAADAPTKLAIVSALARLKLRRAAGPGGITNAALALLRDSGDENDASNAVFMRALVSSLRLALERPFADVLPLCVSEVVLVPKGKNAPTPLDFRPISLLPAELKVMEAAIAHSLKPRLGLGADGAHHWPGLSPPSRQ